MAKTILKILNPVPPEDVIDAEFEVLKPGPRLPNPGFSPVTGRGSQAIAEQQFLLEWELAALDRQLSLGADPKEIAKLKQRALRETQGRISTVRRNTQDESIEVAQEPRRRSAAEWDRQKWDEQRRRSQAREEDKHTQNRHRAEERGQEAVTEAIRRQSWLEGQDAQRLDRIIKDLGKQPGTTFWEEQSGAASSPLRDIAMELLRQRQADKAHQYRMDEMSTQAEAQATVIREQGIADEKVAQATGQPSMETIVGMSQHFGQLRDELHRHRDHVKQETFDRIDAALDTFQRAMKGQGEKDKKFVSPTVWREVCQAYGLGTMALDDAKQAKAAKERTKS